MISTIIPVFNAERTIALCFDSILKNSYKDFEIIAVDDGSKDRSLAITDRYAKRFGNIKLIRANHRGPSAARNEGAKIARGEILVFVDSDCIVAKDWLQKIWNNFKKHKVQAVAGQYNDSYDKGFFSRFALYELLFRERRFGKFMPSGSTCNFSVKRDVFLALGGFPEDIMAGEDIFFSNQVSLRGKILWDKNNGVTHCFKTTLKGYLKQQFGYTKNSMRLFIRHPSLAFQKTLHDKTNYLEIVLTGLLLLSLVAAPFNSVYLLVTATMLALLVLINIPFISFLIRRQGPLFALKSVPIIISRNFSWLFGAFRGLIWD